MPGSTYDIIDLLISSGFPHITVSENNRSMAYECCLVHEVITKRVAALDDIRRGLGSVTVRNKTCLNLLEKWPELKTRFDGSKSGCYFSVICIRKLKFKFPFLKILSTTSRWSYWLGHIISTSTFWNWWQWRKKERSSKLFWEIYFRNEWKRLFVNFDFCSLVIDSFAKHKANNGNNCY